MIHLMLILSFLLSIFLLLVMIQNDRKRVSSRLFSWILVCIAVWTMAIFAFLFSESNIVQVLSIKIVYVLATVFPPLFLFFTIRYPRESTIPRSLVWVSSGLVLVLVGAILLFENTILPVDSVMSGVRPYVVDQPSYIWFSAHFIAFFLGAMIVAGRKFLKYRGDEKKRIGIYALGMVLASVPGFYADLYMPYTGDYSMIWVGPVAVVLFLGSVAYGIIRHRMFDLRVALVRSVAYSLTLTVLAAVYYLIVYRMATVLTGDSVSPEAQMTVSIFSAMILAVSYQSVQKIFSGISNNIFNGRAYSQDQFLANISSIIITSVDLDGLMARSVRSVARNLGAGKVAIVVRSSDDQILQSGVGGRLLDKDVEVLYSNFKTLRDVLLVRSLDDDEPKKSAMLAMGIEVIMPLRYRGRVDGYMVLGQHKFSDFDMRDANILSMIMSELSIAIQNAISVQKIQDFNKSLNQKINAATADLQASNKKLKALDRSKDEFISLTSHQLRTPLTTIKGYLSMILDGDAGAITPQQRKLLEETFNSSQRMVHLINDFLNISRIQTGRFQLELTDVNLADVLEEEIQLLRISASPRRIVLDYQKPDDFPTMELDEGKLRQVMMNFIDNAIHYSPSDSKIWITLSSKSGEIEFTVKDQGIGVPKAEQHKLFVKFARATNARQQRPDGTGIGLFMAKKVVVALGGSIIFESVEGKGSTFGFRIPK